MVKKKQVTRALGQCWDPNWEAYAPQTFTSFLLPLTFM